MQYYKKGNLWEKCTYKLLEALAVNYLKKAFMGNKKKCKKVEDKMTVVN